MMDSRDVVPQDVVDASMEMRNGLWVPFRAPFMIYKIECVGADGALKWEDSFHNLVTTVGKNDLLTQYFKGSAYSAGWYVGLKGAGAAAATDTMSAHSTWTEATGYTIGANASIRATLALGTPASGSVDNSASKAQFSMNAAATIAGAFVVNNNGKGGTTGVLYSAGDFAGGSRSVVNGDTLNVTVTLSAT
jgi:hypothetical protein